LNIQDYISSGILETYLLGLAAAEEARELEQLCLQYPEVKAALEEAERLMEDYTQLHAIAPPMEAKEQIWAAIEQSAISAPTVETTVPVQKLRSTRFPYLTAAAILLIVGGVPYHLYKMNTYEKEISILEQEKREIIVQNKNFEARIKQANEEVDVLAAVQTKSIVLAGVAGHEDKQANLFISGEGELYISANTLEKLPENQQYQLWGIVNGKPVSAGLIDTNQEGVLQEMTSIDRAELYAITIEKRGGSETPTLTQMVVAGKP
jgi:anti-sigma-K factor RskA